jgi:MFS family permease
MRAAVAIDGTCLREFPASRRGSRGSIYARGSNYLLRFFDDHHLNAAKPIIPHAPDSRRWLVVVLLFVAMLVNYVDRGNLSIAAVPLMREFGIAPAAMGALLSAFFWTYAFLQIPAGYLVDRFGLKWTYAGAFALWCSASFGIGMAGSFQQILALRLLLGAGESAATPASLAYIRQNFRENQQGLPTALYVSGMLLGPAVGAFLGTWLMTGMGWRMLFVLTGLGALIWLLPWFIWAPAAPARAAVRATSAPRAAIPWGMLVTRPTFWGITISAFFYSYFSYFCLTWLPSYLVMVRGYSFVKMGAYTAAPYLGSILVSFSSARIADKLISRLGRPMLVRKLFVSAGFILGSSIVLLLVIRSSGAVLATLVFSLLGIGLATGNYWAVTEALSPRPIVGRVVGYQNMVASLGGICAPMLTGFLVGKTKSFDMSILIASATLLMAAGAYVVLLRERDVSALKAAFPDT